MPGTTMTDGATGTAPGTNLNPITAGSRGHGCDGPSPTRTVSLGPTVFTAELHIMQLPARMLTGQKFAEVKGMLLDAASKPFRHARSLRRWTTCVYQPTGSQAALTIMATCERLVPTTRLDNLRGSWVQRFKWHEADGSTFQPTGRQWVRSALMGFVYCDLQPSSDGYTATASRMLNEAREQDPAGIQTASNLQPPRLPSAADSEAPPTRPGAGSTAHGRPRLH